ncbi:MAG TPA: choline/ethanolamine kinase family protein [Geminicoccaceae bacterium]|nr:choline/ethanolamine kinase family protein [Geminicoccus sp.]HMU52024.1 choline/ethanolamine kinase family protein [Geminicoccaceae bacterium]
MEDAETQAARAALERLPAISGLDPATAAIGRLGGLTNLVFRVDGAGRSWCLRLPGKGTEAYIDRAAERHNAAVAAEAGVSPTLVHFDPASGVMLTGFVDGATMSGEAFRDSGAVARAAVAFRRLHTSGLSFSGRFDLFAKMDEYQALLDRLGAPAPEGYADAKAAAEAVRPHLADVPLVPCHCDPLAENFIDAGERMWIVDWEYSGANDPMWDLGDLSVEAGFAPEQDAALMQAYFAGPPPVAEQARMVVHKAMCDLLWTLWGVIQHANGNPAEDFAAYARGRLERCRRLMATEEYAAAIRELQR